MISEPHAVVAALAVMVACVFQAARLAALAPLFERLPALVWAYVLPMLATTCGLLPAGSPLYGQLARHLLLPSLTLLLISSELPTVARLGRTALVMMAAGSLGIALGGLAAFGLLRPFLPPDGWRVTAALVATWIGGSANLVAVAGALDIDPALQGVAIVVDTLVAYSWMGVLIWLAGRQQSIDARWGAERGGLRDVALRLRERQSAERAAPTVADLTAMLGLALGLSAVCVELGARLPEVGRVLNGASWAVVLLTTAALLLSLTPVARLESRGASTVGYAGFYLLLASVGAQADLKQVAAQPVFVLLGVLIVGVHALVLLVALRLLRAPLFFFGAASQACVGGYSSAPLVAALYEPQMAAVGLLLAVLGNVVGTYVGLAVAQVLASWA